ncbi:MAG: hypothetical protein SGCHY_004632 [Lobulomycetales sp.]
MSNFEQELEQLETLLSTAVGSFSETGDHSFLAEKLELLKKNTPSGELPENNTRKAKVLSGLRAHLEVNTKLIKLIGSAAVVNQPSFFSNDLRKELGMACQSTFLTQLLDETQLFKRPSKNQDGDENDIWAKMLTNPQKATILE